jgi:hypothetical protein
MVIKQIDALFILEHIPLFRYETNSISLHVNYIFRHTSLETIIYIFFYATDTLRTKFLFPPFNFVHHGSYLNILLSLIFIFLFPFNMATMHFTIEITRSYPAPCCENVYYIDLLFLAKKISTKFL